MTRKAITLEKEQNYREAFLARLTRKLAVPTLQWPTVRCWTEVAFVRIFKQIADELAAEGMKTRLPQRALLAWVCRLGLAAALPIEGESIYLLDIGASPDAVADPLELLMASKASGVVCYFSAVAFHELTTQIVEHHHVAELHPPQAIPPKESTKRERGEPSEGETDVENRPPRALGTLLFRYQGVPFYTTRRSARLVPGVQTWGHGPRSRVRITTLEQTLLDTLSKPFHCGGPEVVFEAWHEAVASRRVDEERLVEYLRAMSYPATVRRLGVMLELVGYTPGDRLRKLLDAYRGTIDPQSPFAHISLLPGVDYQNLNEPWLVNTP